MIIAVLASGTEYRDEMRAGDSSRTSGEAPPATPLPIALGGKPRAALQFLSQLTAGARRLNQNASSGPALRTRCSAFPCGLEVLARRKPDRVPDVIAAC